MSSDSLTLNPPRLSVAVLGVLLGLGALWVVSSSVRGVGTPTATRDGGLRRTRTIRRSARRQAAAAAAAAAASDSSSSSSPEEEEEDEGEGEGEEGEEDELDPMSSLDMRMLQVLCTVAEDQARRLAVVHRGTACNSCQDSPIRGIRYRCAQQCADVDLCERCEAHGVHRHHALLKIAVPQPPLASASMRSQSMPFIGGSGVGGEVPRDAVHRALERQMGRGELASLHASFGAITGGREAMSRAQFMACLGPFADSPLADRLFAFYDADGDGVLGFAELAQGV
ncbi:hypothetical protein GGI21_004909, partial [Coemansia aciculifera]